MVDMTGQGLPAKTLEKHESMSGVSDVFLGFIALTNRNATQAMRA
jgi:hypothetical protein